MGKPSFKVMHLQDLDQRSTCLTLVHCLAIVRSSSRQHPEHLPVFILVECKTARIPAPSGGDLRVNDTGALRFASG